MDKGKTDKDKGYSFYALSQNAKIEQQLVFAALEPKLPPSKDARILDAACGTGWLAGKLAAKYGRVWGFDVSHALISEAKENFPEVDLKVADAAGELPYQNDCFDAVILNMAAHDIEDLPRALTNFSRILKPGGKLLMAVANPYYAFPVGIWKRGWLGFLLRRKPVLKLRDYAQFCRNPQRGFVWKKDIRSYFYTLPEYVKISKQAGFDLLGLQEIMSGKDSSRFDRSYQMFRFPLILLLELEKPRE